MKKRFCFVVAMLVLCFMVCFGSGETVVSNTQISETAENLSPTRSIVLSVEDPVVYVGKSLKVGFTVEKLQDTAPKQTTLVWSSSDPAIAAVNANGQVSGKKSGSVTIMASAKDDPTIMASVDITVRVPVQAVQINEKKASVVIGGNEAASKTQLTVTVKPADAFFQTGKWTSSNEDVATVDEHGVVTGRRAGNANITFTSDDPNGQRKAQINVTVGQAVTSISMSKSATVQKNNTVSLQATAGPKDATTKKLEFTSSNPSVASVSGNGSVKGVSCGKATITAKATDGSGITAKCEVQVIQQVTNISSGDRNIVIFQGDEKRWSTSVEPYDATNKKLTFSSDNSFIASVDSDGKIKGERGGRTRITASATDGSNRKASVNVTVEPSVPLTLESIGHGVYMADLLALTVKNQCSTMTIVDFDFDITFYDYRGNIVNSGSCSLGKQENIPHGATKTIKRTMYGTSQAYKTVITITGVKFSDGSYWSIPYSQQETWSFTR